MKARGVIVIDYDFGDKIIDIAREHKRLEESMEYLKEGSKYAVFGACDIKERRGDKHPNLDKMKFRTS